MFTHDKDFFLMGQRNMMCIVQKQGIDFSEFLFGYMGIKSKLVKSILIFVHPILYTLNIICSLLITIFKFFVAFFISIFRKQREIGEYNELYLNFTYMFIERTRAADLYQKSKYWIIGPNISDDYIPKEKTIVDYVSNISMTDNFVILSRSLNTIINYMFHERSLCLVHKAWQFYEVQVGLSKLTNNSILYFANQSDKYATLIDSLPSRRKVLLQHGIALNWDKLPYPLHNVDEFYSISNLTWQDAYQNILDCNPELKFFNPTIKLTDLNCKKKSVLIVSEITYFEQEKEMLKSLKEMEVDIFLKKHPGLTNDYCYINLQKDFKFTYITEKVFPRVDFVISYFSTLAFEYMAHDVPVYLYHSKEEYDNEEMIKQLNEVIIKSNESRTN